MEESKRDELNEGSKNNSNKAITITMRLHFSLNITNKSTFICLTLFLNITGQRALPGLRSSLRLEGESMRRRASAASKVLSEQWILVPWTEASTEIYTIIVNKQSLGKCNFTGYAKFSPLDMTAPHFTLN